jgi:hypothetical protein
VKTSTRLWLAGAGLLLAVLAACGASPGTPASTSTRLPLLTPTTSVVSAAENACQLSEPAWVQPPEDPAVQDTPGHGYYFVNADRTIWASAWWTGQTDDALQATGDGIKVGWFRPEGAPLEITGRRLDAPAPPLDSHVPCCYPTRFQATGLIFPEEGCWQVTARAAESELSFVVWVDP